MIALNLILKLRKATKPQLISLALPAHREPGAVVPRWCVAPCCRYNHDNVRSQSCWALRFSSFWANSPSSTFDEASLVLRAHPTLRRRYLLDPRRVRVLALVVLRASRGLLVPLCDVSLLRLGQLRACRRSLGPRSPLRPPQDASLHRRLHRSDLLTPPPPPPPPPPNLLTISRPFTHPRFPC
jgi:hypothetical protein